MKNILSVIVVALVLVAVVTGRGGMHRYDARLAAADSLMHDVPDSALALVQAVDPASLTREGDRAYRDLLLTQARYRCYITATSDSDINRALAYYRRHDGEREKLTRAYIYKGAVMEELGHPDSAMLYYKHAEATAAPDDYFNLGYTNMRMGALYRDHYSMDGKHIEKYETALRFLLQTQETKQQLACMINLGSLYRLKYPKKSESILLSAKEYAYELNDTDNYIKSINSLIQTYHVQKKYRIACDLIHEMLALQNKKQSIEFYTNAATIYSKLGMPDSAEFLLSLYGQPIFSNVIEEISYLESLSEVALAKGDKITYQLLDNKCKAIEDSLQKLDTPMRIMQTEISQDKNFAYNSNRQNRLNKICLIGIIILALSILFLSSYLYYRRSHQYDRIIADLKSEFHSHVCETNELQERINDLKIKDQGLKEYFDSHLWLMREVIEECYYAPNDKLVTRIRNIIQFRDQNKEKWSKLNDYIDLRFNNIMSNTKNKYPNLDSRDMMLLALSILGFSCVQIAIIMGYSNPSSIGTIRQRLAKKMGLETSVMQYINNYLQDNH